MAVLNVANRIFIAFSFRDEFNEHWMVVSEQKILPHTIDSFSAPLFVTKTSTAFFLTARQDSWVVVFDDLAEILMFSVVIDADDGAKVEARGYGGEECDDRLHGVVLFRDGLLGYTKDSLVGVETDDVEGEIFCKSIRGHEGVERVGKLLESRNS